MRFQKSEFYYFLTLLCIAANTMNAASIKGHVLDSKTKESLIGAIIFNKEDSKIHDAAGLDGSYSIKKIKTGTYTFAVQYIGYVKQEKTVTIKDDNETVTLDFTMEAESVNLNETTVAASSDKESDSYARTEEKNSESVINVMSAKTIQLLPDLTVGNVLQRVSGVTVEKTAGGDGRYATIRGMDKRYNYTMINGVKIPSPDNKNRFVPMDIFPSDILERLEVLKSLTPSMEGDAIGGAMNLVLKDAPDKFILSANLATGYSQTLFDRPFNQFNSSVINNQSPEQIHGTGYSATAADFPLQNLEYKAINPLPNLIAGFTIGDRFFNHKLGVLVSGSYQDIYSGSSAIFIVPNRQPDYTPANSPSFTDIEVRSYSLEQKRGAVHTKLDYEFNRKHKISFYTLYTSQKEIRQRQFSDTSVAVPIGEIAQHWESMVTNQNIYSSTLKGVDTLMHNLALDWTAAYSRAWATTPDWTTFSTTDNFWNSMTSRWMSNSDQDLSGYVNLTYKLKINKERFNKIFGDGGIELKAGAMNRNKNRDNQYDEYDFSPTKPNEPVSAISSTVFSLPPNAAQGTPQDANNYSFLENINAYYGMAKFSVGPRILLLGGARMENTSQNFITDQPISIAGKTGSKTYSDILPSGQLKFKINEKQSVRASYFASLTRPGYYDLIPFTITGEYFDEKGNPYLKHTQADNYDIRYEFFPKPSEQLLVGVFYKNITNAIESAFVPGSGPSKQYLQPLNASGIATNYGFEFVYTKYFGHFGVSANYTYTKSEIVDTVRYYYHDAVLGNTFKSVQETRPLQGQADNIGNLSLIYKNPKIGLDLLVSAVYTGKLISQISPTYGLDYWQMPMTRLDFSFEKKLSKKMKLSLYGKVNNILNTGLTVRMMQAIPSAFTASGPTFLPEQTTTNSIIVEKELYGQSYLLGLRYKF